jgi:SprT-like family
MLERPLNKRSYNPVTKSITQLEYGGLQKAYDFFKGMLFHERDLPDVLITYQRKARSFGYFAPDRFKPRVGERGRHELALNPDGFRDRTDKEILSTLVHEMCHVWQQQFGTPPRRAYHDREWAAKMKEVGLQPSSTGMIGGKEVGQHMSHYIIPSGAFDQAYEQLANSGWKLNLESASDDSGSNVPKKPTRTKFTCANCGLIALSKHTARLACLDCNQPMLSTIT